MKENNLMFNLKIFDNMKRTGTMTPDGKGGFNIELNDPKKGFVDVALTLAFSAAAGAATTAGGWLVTKFLKKLDKES